MTNETTASQPMQELVRDLYNFEGGRHFALRLEKMLASQPKSIGDDAQFLWLMCGITGVDTSADNFKRLVEFLDSKLRAPAAQASATIQAAPDAWMHDSVGRVDAISAEVKALWQKVRHQHVDHYTIPLYRHRAPVAANAELEGWNAAAKELTERAGGHFRAGSYDLQDECLQCASMLHDIKPAPAATIQEPVMVAEPDEVERLTLELQNQRELTQHWKARANYVNGPTSAAPMVADPAGVTLLDSRFLHSKEIASDEPIVDSTRLSFWRQGWNAYRNAVAATVKAVPSEALEGCEHCLHTYCLSGEICTFCGDVNGMQGYKGGKIAAPLADKTGGGA